MFKNNSNLQSIKVAKFLSVFSNLIKRPKVRKYANFFDPLEKKKVNEKFRWSQIIKFHRQIKTFQIILIALVEIYWYFCQKEINSKSGMWRNLITKFYFFLFFDQAQLCRQQASSSKSTTRKIFKKKVLRIWIFSHHRAAAHISGLWPCEKRSASYKV